MSTSIRIQSPDEQALSAMLEHHAELSASVDERVRALRAADPASYDQPLAALVAYLAESVLAHAAAEESTLYRAAQSHPTTALLVESMVLEHRELEKRTRALASAASAPDAVAQAETVAALFTLHVRKENEVLLPAFAELPGTSLAEHLRAMHERLSEPAEPFDVSTPPTEVLDVRALVHGQRHEIIFSKLDALQDGARLVIVNDHDPSPLRYQLDAMWPGEFDWDYLEAGPRTWQVAITRRP